VRVSQLARGADDGYRSALALGLKSSADAERLAEELAFAVTRLVRLADDPPGLYAEVADANGEIEERTWLAFLIAYLGPLDGEDPFADIRRVRTAWSGAELPDRPPHGPRSLPGPAHAGGLSGVGGARGLPGSGVHGRGGVDSGASLRPHL